MKLTLHVISVTDLASQQQKQLEQGNVVLMKKIEELTLYLLSRKNK
jgi:hypothetical protein